MQYQQQQTRWFRHQAKSCDLLENNYLCSISNNEIGHNVKEEHVVICLKTTTFAVSATTTGKELRPPYGCDLLENNYLCSISNNLAFLYLKQFGCDLLENNYLCSISNNF
ncbi:hypothetical protein HMPREF9135_2163 [Segatella baroniae F0067]|uniref:Uncharacterized protein n=1 Tax=Segatella baroniae F0067 TaxID=1115809 RepID=U2P686_9BACT|nr:hypothetical protein HMPREF9135_2163 [Segatella baroniae F0067]